MRSTLKKFYFILLMLSMIPSFSDQGLFAQELPEGLLDSVVRIDVSYFEYSYDEPYKDPVIRRASGTGFIISGNRILTNAHVVSQANTIRVRRPDQRNDAAASIIHIAHDCDLALLVSDDPAFFRGAQPLEIGEPPELNSPVTVIGFPIGGERISVTRGIVSRMDMDLYSHSRIDSHLTVQVDAAINPGNSGGPGLQNGRVIGVAFQIHSAGENLGYLIPPVVIRRFLKDVEDGKYDGYIEFGTLEFPTANPVLREALSLNGLDQFPDTGVLVTDILPGSSADGYLKRGDVILSVNGLPISQQGEVESGGKQIRYTELIDNLEAGEVIDVTVYREGSVKKFAIPARATDILSFRRMDYDGPPRIKISGGLIFQPLNENLMDAKLKQWAIAEETNIRYRYDYFIAKRLWQEFRETVVLTGRLGDPINLYAGRFLNGIVESVNDKKIVDFDSFRQEMDRAYSSGEYLVIRFENDPVPLVMKTGELQKADARIIKNYGLRRNNESSGGEP
jgi:S1-C subfamily serine protease